MNITLTPRPTLVDTSSAIFKSSTLAERQVAPAPLESGPTTSSYDYWWPFPEVTTTTSTAPLAGPPILISMVSESSSLGSSSITISSSSSSSSTATTFYPSSKTVPFSSQLPTSSSSASHESMFNLIDLVPVAAAIGTFLLGITIWFIYGCCTRRPRIREDDHELICGPPYVPDHDHDDNPNNEGRPGYASQSHYPNRYDYEEPPETNYDGQMIEPQKYATGLGRRRINSERYHESRWPSYHEPPPFDPAKGFYVPPEYRGSDDEGDQEQYVTASLVPLPENKVRRTVRAKASSSRKKVSMSKRSTPPSRSLYVSPTPSDTTSVALMKMYESDEEGETKREKRDIPWENLRHKSIKRGILEQVEKENTWIDSIRSSIVGSGSALLERGRPKRQENSQDMGDKPVFKDQHSQHHHVGKRRGHVRADSDLRIEDISQSIPPIATSGASEDDRVNNLLPVKPLKVSRQKVSSAENKYTPVPIHISATQSKSRSKSKSRSQSSSPVKPRIYNGNTTSTKKDFYDPLGNPIISRDVLPTSPAQIMSPPLESQMCFTPTPPVWTKTSEDGNTRAAGQGRLER